MVRYAREHPRARGENGVWGSISSGFGGTSPRTRGKRIHQTIIARNRRNIPAHAGKTIRVPHRCLESGEHPRARGENFTTVDAAAPATGTSPRTRGKP